MGKKCISCKNNEIYVKKRELCRACYQRLRSKVYKERMEGWRKEAGIVKQKESSIVHDKEMEFVQNFFKHNNWVYQPATFRLSIANYTPDFYDGERNVFVEVSGTRQAFHANKNKYLLLKRIFPLIKFEVRYATGELLPLDEENGKFHKEGKR